jgi:hypothetical protein
MFSANITANGTTTAAQLPTNRLPAPSPAPPPPPIIPSKTFLPYLGPQIHKPDLRHPRALHTTLGLIHHREESHNIHEWKVESNIVVYTIFDRRAVALVQVDRKIFAGRCGNVTGGGKIPVIRHTARERSGASRCSCILLSILPFIYSYTSPLISS